MKHWRKFLSALALTVLLFGSLNVSSHTAQSAQVIAGDNPAGGAGSG
jgi:cytochrome c biogenesis factor